MPSPCALGRLQVLQRHLVSCKDNSSTQRNDRGICYRTIEISPPPNGLAVAYSKLFTNEFLEFFNRLFETFSERVDMVLRERKQSKLDIESGKMPSFVKIPAVSEPNWKVAEIPPRLRNRKLDLGDISPAVTESFIAAMNCPIQGIQTDFDDGHCPTWKNQLLGLYNIYLACRNELPGAPPLDKSPVLMLRPRAWNMTEHNFTVRGRGVAGPLLDFALLVFHNGTILYKVGCGPFFYLSKVENSSEARLWNDIFTWAENCLQLPYGCIKSCVLIENVLAAFQMEAILYELRDHCIGLNCGIWDYSASIISLFGRRRDFMIPDRNKYVDVDKLFLKSYMKSLLRICHKRGALATGGMAALVLGPTNQEQVIQKVCQSKLKEIYMGLDGFMVHDIGLVRHINALWKENCAEDNQLNKPLEDFQPTAEDLLTVPAGGVTFPGLQHNIAVAVLFIEAWLNGKGTFVYRGAVEDSATAEISRWQVWQWILFQVEIEQSDKVVTRQLVFELVDQFIKQRKDGKNADGKLLAAAEIFKELVTSNEPPVFITSYLNDHILFRMFQNN